MNDPQTASETLERENALVQAVMSGHKESFSELIRPYQSRIYGMAMGYTRNPEEAKDLAQDVFVATFQSLPRFDRVRPFRNWILKIATHHCYMFLRKRGRPTPPPPLPPPEADPLDVQVETESREEIRAAFHRLEEDQKMVVWLYYFFNRSCQEIAEILEISLALVKVRLFRARQALGSILVARENQSAAGVPQNVSPPQEKNR